MPYKRLICNDTTKLIYVIKRSMIEMSILFSKLNSYHNVDDTSSVVQKYSIITDSEHIMNQILITETTEDVKKYYASGLRNIVVSPNTRDSITFIQSVMQTICNCAINLHTTLSQFFKNTILTMNSTLIPDRALKLFHSELQILFTYFKVHATPFKNMFDLFEGHSENMLSYIDLLNSMVRIYTTMLACTDSAINCGKYHYRYDEIYISEDIYDPRMDVNQIIINKYEKLTDVLDHNRLLQP